mmetsp:Transcript_6375/g.15250  ORF Transcript_6375/g.15250 Transcript_6375/m.15250 type:complete len:103 (+) Transcript_6375:1889-2197(+)
MSTLRRWWLWAQRSRRESWWAAWVLGQSLLTGHTYPACMAAPQASVMQERKQPLGSLDAKEQSQCAREKTLQGPTNAALACLFIYRTQMLRFTHVKGFQAQI